MSALAEAWLGWRNRMIADARFQRWAAGFPLTRFIARRRARALFDLCAGFVYSQVLAACVELDVFGALRAGPRSCGALAPALGLTPEATRRLLRAAASLDLLRDLGGDRFALGDLGAAMLGNPGVAAMVAHHRVLYGDLADPVALLRGEVEPHLRSYWGYASSGPSGEGVTPANAAAYSELMARSQAMLADDVLDACDMGGVTELMDVGGGEGVFAARAAERHPGLNVTVFDLPAVASRAADRLSGLGQRAHAIGGSFLTDDLPRRADAISLIRVLHDHDDESVSRLLAQVRAALPAGGLLLVAEPFAGARGAEPVGDAYFGFYLLAMGQGRARRPDELVSMLAKTGFLDIREVRTRRPMLTGVIVARG